MVVECFWNVHKKIPVLKCLLNKVAGLQDCCKTCLSQGHLRFYFSLGKTLKISSTFCRPCSSKSVKCKVIFTEPYLEPSRWSAMEVFCENSYF